MAENEGIIYSTHLDSPPTMNGGINVLYGYLEENVKVYQRDVKIFADYEAVVLYQLTIQETGIISNIILKETSASTTGLSYESRYIDIEIKDKIMSFSNWKPAILNKEPVPVTIYLPLKFKVDQNKLIILPSKYIFNFRDRNK